MRNNRLLIAPVFIPHEGCPYRCVFCNQTDITGYKKQADKENVLSFYKLIFHLTIISSIFLGVKLGFMVDVLLEYLTRGRTFYYL